MLDILFPNNCPSCKTIPVEREYLCTTCFSDIKFIDNWSYCGKCGIPFGFFSEDTADVELLEESEDNLCSKCLKDTYTFDRARSIAIYDGRIRDLIIGLKYESKLSFSNTILDILTDNFPCDLDDFDSLVPVPLHINRLRHREYNQSVVIAKGLAKHFSVNCDVFGLKRIRDTRAQIDFKNEDERRRNVKGAFSVTDQDRFKGKSVLLIDDVFTSGSTTDECSKILLKSGAYRVQVLTLARAKGM